MNKCTCTYVTYKNSKAARLGYELPGAVKERCDYCKKRVAEYNKQENSSLSELLGPQNEQEIEIFKEEAKKFNKEQLAYQKQANIGIQNVRNRRYQKEIHNLVYLYKSQNPMRTADGHPEKCNCLRCVVDHMSAYLQENEHV